jgi:hypothetical protein
MKTEVNLDAVRAFALDVWEDLSRTRLAGVAVGLGLALLMITAFALRPSSPPESTAATTATAAIAPVEDEVRFVMPSDLPLEMKDVKLSAARDPFRSLDGGGGDQTLMAAGEELTDAIMASGSTGGVPAAGSDGASQLMPISDLSSDGPPTPTTVADDTVEPAAPEAELEPTPEPKEPADAPVTDYSYTADIQFGRVDDLKRYATVQRLGLVPNRKTPLLMYLGVTADHDTAVFMVDSRLSQGGEGRCVPKESLCTFLELSTSPDQDEHHFRDADGNEYLLRLRRLVRTTASAGSLSGRSVSALDGSPAVVDGSR